jgi:hypothetical protein
MSAKTFTYDVAISFAGEQRAEAEAIAGCLTTAGVNVFYDRFEDAILWGKDLYDHLADVYQNKARYCIILASEAYARKVWPTHERKNAQARALVEKQEYILPVRFDATDIPGLARTVGYLDYRDYGAQGICSAFLRKLGVVDGAAPDPGSYSCTTSLRALVWDAKTQTIAYVPATRVQWGVEEVSVTLEPDDPTDGPFLNSLRGIEDDIIVGYQGNVAICKVTNSIQSSVIGKNEWHLSLRVERADFSPSMEMAFGSTSADQLAERRGRRLLLNENRAVATSDINDITREIFVAGQGTVVKVKRSPFPDFHQSHVGKPRVFLEVAWVHAATMLKLAAVVEHIQKLALALKQDSLDVDFVGTRKKIFQNAPPYEVRIKGTCSLVPDAQAGGTKVAHYSIPSGEG